MIRVSVASSMAVVEVKANEGSAVGRGEGDLTLLNLSLGVSFRFGSCRWTTGELDVDDCCLVTRVDALEVVGEAADAFVDAAAVDVAAVESSAGVCDVSSSSPHGHMEKIGESRVVTCIMQSPNELQPIIIVPQHHLM